MIKKIWILFTICFIAVVLIINNELIGQGIQKGLHITYQTIIPSLFPFMVLSSFLIHSRLYTIMSIPLALISKYFFGLDSSLGSVVCISFIGGFPVGTKNISMLYQSKLLDKDTAEKMLSYCINAGPAFIIGGIGGTILKNPTIGFILFFSQVLASMFIGLIMRFFIKPTKYPQIHTKPNYIFSFTESVSSTVTAIFSISAFVVLFSALITYIETFPIPDFLKHILFSLLEVTTSSIHSASLSGFYPYLLLSFSLSFCGLSVLLQISSILSTTDLSLKYFFLSRLVHFPLSYFITIFLIQQFPQNSTVISPIIYHQPKISNYSFSSLIFLLFTIFSIIFSVQNKLDSYKKRK